MAVKQEVVLWLRGFLRSLGLINQHKDIVKFLLKWNPDFAKLVDRVIEEGLKFRWANGCEFLTTGENLVLKTTWEISLKEKIIRVPRDFLKMYPVEKVPQEVLRPYSLAAICDLGHEIGHWVIREGIYDLTCKSPFCIHRERKADEILFQLLFELWPNSSLQKKWKLDNISFWKNSQEYKSCRERVIRRECPLGLCLENLYQ